MSAHVAPSVTEMAQESAVSRFAEWVDYRLNPMLVKDVRGWLRSKGFLLLFFGGMLIAQIATVLFVISSSNESGGLGRMMFTCIACGLAVICGSFIPYMTYHKLMGELKSKATELAMASYITPSVLVNGKLQSSLAASLLFFTATAPSLAIAYLLGGVDILTAVIAVVMIFAGNLVATLFLMFLAGFGSPALGRILSLLWFFASLGGLATAVGGFMELSARTDLLYTREFWIAVPFLVASAVPVQLFFHSLSVAYLSPVHFNRDTKPRALLSLSVIVSFVLIGTMGYLVNGIRDADDLFEYFAYFAVTACANFSICLFFILGTSEFPSRRVCSNWSRSNLWSTFMFPGIDRLNAYMLLHFAGFFLIAMLGAISERSYANSYLLAVLDMFSFFIAGSLTYNLIAGWCERRGINVNLIYTVLGVNIAWLVVILTVYISMSVLPNVREQDALLFSPITHFSYVVARRSLTGWAYVLPGCMTVLGVIVCISSFFRAYSDGISQRRFTQKLRWLRRNNPMFNQNKSVNSSSEKTASPDEPAAEEIEGVAGAVDETQVAAGENGEHL